MIYTWLCISWSSERLEPGCKKYIGHEQTQTAVDIHHRALSTWSMKLKFCRDVWMFAYCNILCKCLESRRWSSCSHLLKLNLMSKSKQSIPYIFVLTGRRDLHKHRSGTVRANLACPLNFHVTQRLPFGNISSTPIAIIPQQGWLLSPYVAIAADFYIPWHRRIFLLLFPNTEFYKQIEIIHVNFDVWMQHQNSAINTWTVTLFLHNLVICLYMTWHQPQSRQLLQSLWHK